MEDALLFHGNSCGRAAADLFGVFDGHAGREAAAFVAARFPAVCFLAQTSLCLRT